MVELSDTFLMKVPLMPVGFALLWELAVRSG